MSTCLRGCGALCVAVLALTWVGVRSAAADPLSAARQREILRDALNAYDEAVGIARTDPTRATQLYQQAAGGFQALLDSGVQNAALEYNLGNVHFRLGELGRAVLHYRRARRLDPSAAHLAENLRYARDRVEPAIAPSGQSRLARHLLFWHYQTSVAGRGRALLVFSVIGWGLLLAWLRWRRSTVLLSGLVGVILALACGASIYRQLADEARSPPAVVVGAPQMLRLGRGEGSDLALKQALGPGVELRILQQRHGWVEVRLPDGLTGWLPGDAVERV